MLIDVILVVNNEKDINRFMTANLSQEPYVTYLNESYNDDKKKAWAIKNEFGAKEVPFIVVRKDGKLSNIIYKEDTEDPIQKLINYLS